MRRRLALAAVLLLTAPPVAGAHLLDHPFPTVGAPLPPLSTEFLSGGDNAEWELLATIPTLNPHSDIDFFQQKGVTYVAVGNLGIGVNGGGQVIFKLTDEQGEVTPELVSNIPTASCVSDPSAALGLQHDVEATPKASTIANTEVRDQNTQDTRLLIDATDAYGRCHDQGTLGQVIDAPNGGLEIIDVTNVAAPKEIGLTSHIGEAHTVNIDPRRPHIAYVSSSDSVSVNAEGVRSNESGTGNALDGIEIVDLRSCLEAPLGTIPAGATIEQKREACRPSVYRYRWPTVEMALGHTNKTQVHGCHELEVYPDDRLTCAAGYSLMLFDIKGVFDDNGTPDDYTDDKVKGSALPCSVRDSSTTVPLFSTGAKVTDCVTSADDKPLGVPGWIDLGSPSAAGFKHVGSAFHMGREDAVGAVQPAYGASEDIDFDHEAELTDSRKFIIATDERGGGVTGGAQCSPGVNLEFANGGLHAYSVDRLQKNSPTGDGAAEKAFETYARDSQGEKAIYIPPVETLPQATFCTAHVFQQIPGENRIFMGWYSQGTQVVDFTETKNGTIDFKRAGYLIPELTNAWVSAIFKVERNADGTSTYYGATGDGVVGPAGRQGIDIYRVTLPAAPLPPNRVPPANAPPGTNPNAPQTPGLPTEPGQTPTDPGCAVTSGFTSAVVAPEKRGLRFDFSRAVDEPVRADVFQSSKNKRLVSKRVVRFNDRTRSFVWKGRKKGLGKGTFVARLRIKTPGRIDTRRFSFLRRKGEFRLLPDFKTPVTCGLLRKAELQSNAFGGKRNKKLNIRFRLSQAAQVEATVKRGRKTVKTFDARTFQPGKTRTLSLKARKRGPYRVILSATRGQTRANVTLSARRV